MRNLDISNVWVAVALNKVQVWISHQLGGHVQAHCMPSSTIACRHGLCDSVQVTEFDGDVFVVVVCLVLVWNCMAMRSAESLPTMHLNAHLLKT